METFKKILGVAVTLLVYSTAAFAEVNPTTATETSSTGSSDLSVTIPVLYRISAIEDRTTANYTDNTSSVSLSMNDEVCVYTNAVGGSDYRIRMQGSSTCTGDSCPGTPSDTFAISNDTNNQFIPYTVYWNDEDGTSGRAVIGTVGGAQATSTNQSGASRDWQCSGEGGTNANFSVDFNREDILDVLSGAYTGTLTITLLPPT